MRRIFFAVLALALVAGFADSPSFAQDAPQSVPPTAPAAAPAGRMPPNTPPQLLDLGTAKKMAAAVEAAAAAQNQHVAICVMDARGDMVLFERMEMVNIIPVGSSQAKAHAVLLFGIPTSQIASAMSNGTRLFAPLRTTLTGGGDLDLRPGGLPIMKNGRLIGSIGVGGSASESDEQFAQAGIDSLTAK